VTSTYRSNGQIETVTDAENNKTTYEYDGQDRLAKTRFPSPTKGAGTSSTTDYEQPSYDANGNVTSFRNRAAETIGLTFDALNRMTAKDLPGSEPDVAFTYDLLGRMTGASQTGHALTFTYDALGRNLTQVGPQGTVTSAWDIAGRRTRLTHPDAFYVDQESSEFPEEYVTTIMERGKVTILMPVEPMGLVKLAARKC
jgi:YD repeat-containing protein